MKKIIAIASLVLVTCLFTACDKKRELYKQVDYFVEQLDTTQERYDILGTHRATVVCDDRVYSVTPVGRLINIKIDGYVPDTEYEDLRTSLEKHYQGDIRVNEVYVTKLGTVVVDCRH